MQKYTQLAREQRYLIYELKRIGHTQKSIATVVGCHPSTICRELQRNTGLRGYRPRQAHETMERRRARRAMPRIPRGHWRRVEVLLRADWSPEQISAWLRREEDIAISHTSIYKHVATDKQAGGTLHRHLRCQKRRRKRRGGCDRRGRIPDCVSIDQRPAIVDARARIGDWEADTMIGGTGGMTLITLCERATRHTVAALCPNKTARSTAETIIAHLAPLSGHVHTITFDNGKEFAGHKHIARALQCDGYFAHPYHSWERGLNENTNGLIRQYLTKGSRFDGLTEADVRMIVDKLNNRPRKCLGYRTPNQVLFGIPPPVALTT